MLTFTLVAVLFISEIAAAPQPDTAGDTDEQKLQIISVSKEHLEANFYTPTGGIQIVSKVRDDGELVRVSITSTSGETMFAVDYPLDQSQGLLTINGDEFFVVKETLNDRETKLTAYSVPEAYSVQVKTEMKHHILSKSLLGQLDREHVNTTARTAIEHFLMRTDVQIIAAAAVALGNTGLHGRDNPAAMAFYATALRIATILSQDHATISPQTEGTQLDRYRRQWPWQTEMCSSTGGYCYPGQCPRGSNCLGLCGPGCLCWWFVCRDCCYNVGCYLHDVYGCSGGTDTWSCWLSFPIGLICS